MEDDREPRVMENIIIWKIHCDFYIAINWSESLKLQELLVSLPQPSTHGVQDRCDGRHFVRDGSHAAARGAEGVGHVT